MTRSALWIVALVLGATGVCSAADEAAPKFKSEEGRTAVRAYEEALKQAAKQHEEAVKAARARYIAALDAATKAAMARQDLDEANRLNDAKKHLETIAEAPADVTVAAGVPMVLAIPAADPALAIVGTWRYPNDTKITYRPNGTYTVSWRNGDPGTWKYAAGRKFLVGKDMIELSEDLNSYRNPNPKAPHQTIVRVSAKEVAADTVTK